MTGHAGVSMDNDRPNTTEEDPNRTLAILAELLLDVRRLRQSILDLADRVERYRIANNALDQEILAELRSLIKG